MRSHARSPIRKSRSLVADRKRGERAIFFGESRACNSKHIGYTNFSGSSVLISRLTYDLRSEERRVGKECRL